ncbi:glutamine amidotransferase domain-containing protein [Arcobacter venerupis]|uniref:Glutamine amidotransferase domain-containing protein n=1 Tax=Arcobacter venerupis TaxID=1054033 RepID=A0AAE7B7D5_9BACT|nr:glutamine amidotransferase [Arcobacter venerupis]QKF66738.1 glutamine amidotransferase domain-containing protein [Arcobacter venerupis]RWS48171.1 GMP synthase [Arcobacter venerupis]
MKKIYIIKAGTTFDNIVEKYGDFEHWILKYIDDFSTQIIDIQQNEQLPKFENCAGVIITGSHAMVTQELPWSLKIEAFIKELLKHKIPLLGICYGHQLIAKSLGAEVNYHPKGMELGTVNISLSQEAQNDEIFKHLPQTFDVHVVHSQSALTLPLNAIVLASNEFEKNHAFKIEPNIWAVQFHPEYDENIMKAYISEVAKSKNINEDEILAKVKDTNYSNKIIKLFADFVKNKQS